MNQINPPPLKIPPYEIHKITYGDTRLVAFKIFETFFVENNEQKISEIFNNIITQEARKNNLSSEDYLNKIDDNLLSQITIGVVDNINDITNIIKDLPLKNYNKNFEIILILITFELKFLAEISSHNIFEDYQKICQEANIKFDKEKVIFLIEKLREFEF